MPYDPTKPVDDSLAIASELRNQFAGLKDLIDAQAAQIADLQQQINTLQSGGLVAPVLDRDEDNDADRFRLSKALQPAQPDEWLAWKSNSGIGNPDTHPSEWSGPLGWDNDLSDDSSWVIEWNGFVSNNYFIVAYRVGSNRSPFSNMVHP